MKILAKMTLNTYKDYCREGTKIIFGEKYKTITASSFHHDGLEVDGTSLVYIIENYDPVYIVMDTKI